MKKTIIIVFCLLLSKTHFSQQIKVTNDIGAWATANIKKKIAKNFVINLEQQLRFYENAVKFDDYIIDFGGKYKMNKNFKLGVNLRYTYNAKRSAESDNNYRYNLDLNYKGNVSKKLNFSYRLRYQQEFVNLLSEYKKTNVHYSGVRNKVKIKYDINKKNRIYVSGELFRLIETFKDPYFNKVRFYLGDEIKTKIGDFNCSIGYEQEINIDYPLSFFFLKISYGLKL
jgi:hypothetical protein